MGLFCIKNEDTGSYSVPHSWRDCKRYHKFQSYSNLQNSIVAACELCQTGAGAVSDMVGDGLNFVRRISMSRKGQL